jgi:hypothetical protein
MAEVILNGQPTNLPDKIDFINPFDNSDIETAASNNMEWLNNDPSTLTIIIVLPNQFPYIHSTGFAADKYGCIISNGFSDTPFDIGDKVAPVIDNATFCPGKIINTTTTERAHDTLQVEFSEEVNPINYLSPFKLINIDRLPYHFELQQVQKDKNEFTFKVNNIFGVDYPVTGDSIWIDILNEIKDKFNNIQKVDDNRHVPLKVKPKPFQLIITVVGPINPSNYTIPIELLPNNNTNTIQNGIIVIMDPLIDFSDEEMQNVDCEVTLFDPVGNLVAQSDHINNFENKILQAYIKKVGKRNKIVCIWSGKNKNNRDVGAGSYVAAIHVTNPNPEGPSVDKRVFIPVRR